MINKLVERVKRNWGNRKWIIYGAAISFVVEEI
ncbi:hypothetical protein CAT7_04454 [Carnobacterium sp. AT7]|nr:hypothetical protein CAT7_04454 [Carnobacterium sp. AT7]